MKKMYLFLMVLAMLIVSTNEIIAQRKPWVAPKSSNSTINPFKGDEKATVAGKKIFNQMCFICHGLQGKGDGAGGMSLNPKPADFLSSKVKEESDGALFWKISEGNPPMASYVDVYTEKQRWQLVNYIRQLQKGN